MTNKKYSDNIKSRKANKTKKRKEAKNMRQIKIEKDGAIFTIKKEKEHYIIEKNRKFHGSADTLTEAEKDIDNEKE